ncbi:NAD(P)-dependent alcohol dehydrogenase [Actinomycetaceae bacterium L2_0104]
MSANSKAILEEPGKMVIQECERPTPGPDEVVVKIARVGMCGSDIHGFRFGPYIPPQPGQIVGLGHEPSGIVAEVGAEVKDIKVGDRVCLEPGEPCYRCEFCLAGHYNVCPQVDFMATAPNYRGAFAEYIAHPAHLAFRLPDDMTLDEGALVEPASVATHAVEMAGSLLGKTVVILGCGAVGLMVSMVAKMAGARSVVVVDLQERRLDKARDLGVSAAINAGQDDVVEQIRSVVGQYGADVVFETAGAVPTVKLGLQVVKRRGKLMVVGSVPGEAPVSFLSINREVSIQTVFRYCNSYPTTIELIRSGALKASAIVDKHFDYADIQEAFEFAANQPDAFTKAVVVVDSSLS